MDEEKKGESNIKEKTGESKLDESDFINIREQSEPSKQTEKLGLPKSEKLKEDEVKQEQPDAVDD